MISRRSFVGALTGGLLAAPLGAGAQQAASPRRIGVLLNAFSPEDQAPQAFRQGLQEAGYSVGSDVVIEWRVGHGNRSRLPELAADLVQRKVDVIVADSTPGAQAAKNATSTIPIVLALVVDPVGSGLVASLQRPSGNVTGLSMMTLELAGKRLQLLKEAIPSLVRVGVLRNPDFAFHTQAVKDLSAAAPTLSIELSFADARTSADPDDGTEDVGDAQPDELEPPPFPLYAHGDAATQPLKGWLLKNLLPVVGHGLLSGQWGTGKTFIAFDLAAAIATTQPWLNRQVKRRCGVLLIAAEGASEVRLRLDAVIRSKCGGIERAPFRWYENTPPLLQKDASKTLIGMALHADRSLRNEFGLPLGLIIVDTIAACAGYSQAGGENDPATTQAVMNVLKHLSQELGCFVLGVDHFGKNMEAGTRGSSSK